MATKKKTAKKTSTRRAQPAPRLVVVAGDSGVYAGYHPLGAAGLEPTPGTTTGRIELTRARHLRRYYVAGRTGDGSAGDLAARGLDPTSPSVAAVVEGVTVLLGVRRAFDVSPEVAASFGCGQ